MWFLFSEDFKVSRVEINLIINDSDVMAFSPGVGEAKFTATVYLPINTFVVFYSLKIFSCSVPVQNKNLAVVDESLYDEIYEYE